MLFRKRAKYIGVIFAVLLIFTIGCTTHTVDEETPPEPPSSMAIDEGESTEEKTEAEEPVDSFIQTTQLIQAEDGSAIVQVETQANLGEGTYQARYHDSEGGELTAPCLRIEGVDNELQCSIALAEGLQLVEFQLYY